MFSLLHLSFDSSPLSNRASLSRLVCIMYRMFRDTLHFCENSPPTKSPLSWETQYFTGAFAPVATSRVLSFRCASTLATMIHDNTPNCICELTRLIASQLVLISRKSTVNIACACRCLEEPVLSTLWETQSALCALPEVPPEETWDFENP